jgi:L-asparaginase/Glu-tRNA(Gln) amidotransferase subunit D
MNTTSIPIIVMGGTVYKWWNAEEDKCAYPATVLHHQIFFKRYLERPLLECNPFILCPKDGVDIAKEDRDALVAFISKSDKDIFIVLHSIDTMKETVEYVSTAIISGAINKKNPQNIVFLGSRLPFDSMISHAPYLLGIAVTKANLETVTDTVSLVHD